MLIASKFRIRVKQIIVKSPTLLHRRQLRHMRPAGAALSALRPAFEIVTQDPRRQLIRFNLDRMPTGPHSTLM